LSSEASAGWSRDRYQRDDVGWISFGAFLILIAIIYLTTPNIVSEVRDFALDFKLVQLFPNIWWPVPSSNHPVLYNAAEMFCYAFGLVELGILGLRFAKRSPIRGKAEASSSVVFWLGAGYVLGMLSQGVLSWLSFLGALIILIGISIVVRSLILMFARRRPQ
jgi:hypothetical protein